MFIQYLDEHPDATWHHDDLAEGTSAVSALDDAVPGLAHRVRRRPGFADRARARVVALQAGDERTVARWREIVAESELAFREIYDRLGVLLTAEDSAGESFYNDQLAGVVEELTRSGVVVDSRGRAGLPLRADHRARRRAGHR